MPGSMALDSHTLRSPALVRLRRVPFRDTTMTARSVLLTILAASLAVAAGCSSQQVYESGTAFRIQECQQVPDDVRRAECMELARKSYKEYQDLKRDGAR
jgi:hypothetical protein